MSKLERYEKVVEWDKSSAINNDKKWDDKSVLQFAWLCQIPILGQITLIISSIVCLYSRKVYWRKIKC